MVDREKPLGQIWGSILANGNFRRTASPLRILWCPKFVSMFVVVSYSLRGRCPMWSQTRYSICKNLQEVCAQNVVSKGTMPKHVRNVFLICSLYCIIKSCQYGNTMFTKVSASLNASCATIAGFWTHLFAVSYSAETEIVDLPSDWSQRWSHRWKNNLERFSMV